MLPNWKVWQRKFVGLRDTSKVQLHGEFLRFTLSEGHGHAVQLIINYSGSMPTIDKLRRSATHMDSRHFEAADTVYLTKPVSKINLFNVFNVSEPDKIVLIERLEKDSSRNQKHQVGSFRDYRSIFQVNQPDEPRQEHMIAIVEKL